MLPPSSSPSPPFPSIAGVCKIIPIKCDDSPDPAGGAQRKTNAKTSKIEACKAIEPTQAGMPNHCSAGNSLGGASASPSTAARMESPSAGR